MLVTTARKMFTIALSFCLFSASPFTAQHGIGLAIAVAGMTGSAVREGASQRGSAAAAAAYEGARKRRESMVALEALAKADAAVAPVSPSMCRSDGETRAFFAMSDAKRVAAAVAAASGSGGGGGNAMALLEEGLLARSGSGGAVGGGDTPPPLLRAPWFARSATGSAGAGSSAGEEEDCDAEQQQRGGGGAPSRVASWAGSSPDARPSPGAAAAGAGLRLLRQARAAAGVPAGLLWRGSGGASGGSALPPASVAVT